ncbi:MAG: limonene-1,2-epoxide hydrolase family protein [Spongiibacteraceae bacterium]
MTPTRIVTNFFDCWAQGREKIFQSMHDYLAPSAVWENVGLSRTVGPEEAEAAFQAFEPMQNCQRIDVEYIAIAEQGEMVLTERIDHLIDAEGNAFASIRVAGILKVEQGKITEWRDYFDATPFAL